MMYKEYVAKQTEAVNKLPIFYAFSDEQFKHALEERGIKDGYPWEYTPFDEVYLGLKTVEDIQKHMVEENASDAGVAAGNRWRLDAIEI